MSGQTVAYPPERPAILREPAIILAWLVRLRWLAALGQLAAATLAIAALGIHYDPLPLGVIIGITLGSNAALAWGLGRWRLPETTAAGVILLDVVLLTSLLYFTGGDENPFAVLYVLNVALAASALGSRWTGVVLVATAVCYAFVALRHRPLLPDGVEVGPAVLQLGEREAQLREARERVQVGERLAALTTLAAGAAHELGTPLGTIAVVSKDMELSARKLGDDDLADDAKLVREQVDRCSGILERLRGDVAGRGTDEPGTADVADTATDVRDRLRAGKRERVELAVAPDLVVGAPPRALAQALELLVNNALEACDEAGIDAPVRVEGSKVDGFARVSVVDRGPGMSEATARRAAEPFFTTKDPGRGMGLGLFLVRMVAEKSEGGFSITSEPGRGTTVTLDLPLA